MKAPLLLARLLLPLLLSLGLGHWRVGDDGLQAGGGGDLGPAGVEPDPDGDLAVLVGPVLDDATLAFLTSFARLLLFLVSWKLMKIFLSVKCLPVWKSLPVRRPAERTSQADPGRRLEIHTM